MMKKIYPDKKLSIKKWPFYYLVPFTPGSVKIISVVVCIIMASMVFGQDDGISRNTITWSGNVTVSGIFEVGLEDTLNINPGTSIRFEDPNSKLVVFGKLNAEGTDKQPILFWTDNTNGWGGIEFFNAGPSTFNHCNISGINRGVTTKSDNRSLNNGAILVTMTQNAIFNKCLFYSNKGGIVVVNSSNLLMDSCIFVGNQIQGDEYGLVYLENSNNSEIRNNLFHNNKTNLDGIISANLNTSAIIIGNTFSGTKFFVSTIENFGYPVIISISEANYENHLIINENLFTGNGQNNLDVREIVLFGWNFNTPENSSAFIWNNEFIGSNTFPPPSQIIKTAIFAYATTFTASHCTFKNYSKNVIKMNYCNAKIHVNNFEDNSSADGTISIMAYDGYAGDQTIINEIYSNTFTNNSSGSGGAIWSSILPNAKCKLIIEENSFLNNTALNSNGNGGAIFTTKSKNLFIINNSFEQNKSINSGGAVYLLNSDSAVIIKENVFVQNIANDLGGAVCIDQPSSWLKPPLIIKANEFYLDTANQGGGAIAITSTKSLNNNQFQILNNHFYNNTSLINGGALVLINVGVEVDSNYISNNQAEFGGGIYAEDILQSDFTANLIYQNTATNGGGVYLKNLNSTRYESVTTLNTLLFQDTIMLKDNVIQDNNYHEKGGGCYLENCYNIEFTRNLFVFNKYVNLNDNASGGGMYVLNSGLKIYNSDFVSNSAKTNKGAISMNLTLNDSLHFFNNNVVNHFYEGGICFENQVDTAKIFIRNTIFWGNEYKSIRYPYLINSIPVSPIKTFFCYFDHEPAGLYGNIVNINQQVSALPGWNGLTNFYLDCDSSICVDNGDPDLDFNDENFPPSCGGLRNDIGITGGPHAFNNPSLFIITQPYEIISHFSTEIVSIANRIVRIKEESYLKNDENKPIYFRWYFGDGKSTKLAEYTGIQDFTYNYNDNVSKVTILLILDTQYGKHSFTQTIDFTKNSLNVPVERMKESDFYPDQESLILSCSNEDAFNIYPNPTDGRFNLQINTTSGKGIHIRILDVFGKCVYSKVNLSEDTSTIPIDISGNSSGIYFMIIQNLDQSITKKIVLK
jgi:predicted outer membrane repeat protein